MTRPLVIRFAFWSFIDCVVALFISSCLQPPSYVEGVNQMRFRTIGTIPIIEGKINGKRAVFILDTGASCSILNESASRHFGFRYVVKVEEHVLGLGGLSRMNHAYDCKVELGPIKLNQILFRTKHLGDFTDVIWRNESVDIAGILGADVLTRYNISIDFRTKMISF